MKWSKKLNSKLYFKLSTQNLKNMFFLDPESKYEKKFHFKPCVYLAYFMSYGHLKIVKCIAITKNSLLKWPELAGKCIYQLDIWLTDASVNSVKWSKKLEL